jgi:hypothetical protein
MTREQSNEKLMNEGGFVKDPLRNNMWFCRQRRKAFSGGVVRDEPTESIARLISEEVAEGRYLFIVNFEPEQRDVFKIVLDEQGLATLRAVVRVLHPEPRVAIPN